MDWSVLILLAFGAAFFLWQSSKNKERAAAANERLTKDNRLYQHIKVGMREYDWQKRDQSFRHHEDGTVIFENAHMKAHSVSHFAETRR